MEIREGVESREVFEVREISSGKIWSWEQEKFTAIVYSPKSDLPGDIVNFGMDAPFLIVMPEKKLSENEAVEFAEKTGLAKIASDKCGSVVFVYPTKGNWKDADDSLYKDLMASSKIGAVYRDGVLIDVDRFGNNPTEYFIRGAKSKTILFGYGESADYIAKYLLDTVTGEYLWGPGEVTLAVCFLEGLSLVPNVKRGDIPILSVKNTEQINNVLRDSCQYLTVCGKAATSGKTATSGDAAMPDEIDYVEAYKSFLGKYKRWCGELIEEPDYEALDMVNDFGYEIVKTSPDNYGIYKGTDTHPVGYMAWYNKGLMEKGPVPTVIANHGGGDSALHIAKVSGWWEIAHKYDFLLIAVENHTDVTATETIELIDKIKAKFNIDEKRLYATGFSMGGCKSWDFCQEYPERFAALAPMDATFEVGLNFFGKPANRVNTENSVPIFYAGGEITPLPELPFQAKKCHDRIRYVFELNKIQTKYDARFEDRENWDEKIWGIPGDRVVTHYDESRDSTLTLNYFESEDGVERTVLGSVSMQGHECRKHTCEQAWLFMSKFILPG